jgi:HlyD family secretion protein
MNSSSENLTSPFHSRVRRPWALATLLLLATGCHQPAGDAQLSGTPPATPTVTVVKPTIREISRLIEQPAQVEAYEETPLIARIPGYVGRVNVDIGDVVESGAVLAELSVPEMLKEHDQKVAMVKQAQGEVARAKAAHSAALAHVATTAAQVQETHAGRDKVQANLERWNSESKRLADLAAKKVIDEQSRDEAKSQASAAYAICKEMDAKIESAVAVHNESKALADKARADVTAAEASVTVAEAAQGSQAAMLEYAQIRAPYKCVVTKRHIHTGHYLQPGSSARPVFVVVRFDKLRVSVEVPEVDALLVKDQESLIRVQSIKDRDFRGHVVRTGWSLDPKSRNLRVEIDLKNESGVLRPGMYAYATFTVQLGKRLTVPAAAVVTQGDSTYCWLITDGKARRTAIKAGARAGQFVEVLKRQIPPAQAGGVPLWVDFNGDEAVVAANQTGLIDNQAVSVKQ